MPTIYTPDDEPYLGLQALLELDQTISVVMSDQPRIAEYTRAIKLSELQRAATELVPPSLSISMSIREMIRQGYLLSAQILLRPLLERCATLAYLLDHPDAVQLWADGWTWKKRPKLKDRLASMAPVELQIFLTRKDPEFQGIDELVDHYNGLVHGDPVSSLGGAVLTKDGRAGMTVSKDEKSPHRAELIAGEVRWRLLYLHVRTNQVFPDLRLIEPITS